jgi:hypothetical protein
VWAKPVNDGENGVGLSFPNELRHEVPMLVGPFWARLRPGWLGAFFQVENLGCTGSPC